MNQQSSSTLSAHKSVLAGHSVWFADQLLDSGRWVVSDVIYIEELMSGGAKITPAILNAVVEFMYTGRKKIPFSICIPT